MQKILSSNDFYDRLAQAFDVMTEWPKRLAYEMPFLLRIMREYKVKSVLDTACGTGGHAIALAQRGYNVVGCDASPGMIKQAKTNAARAQVKVAFTIADFNELNKFSQKFDALLCLGNSLPHLLTKKALLKALRQMQLRLNPGGVLILHNLNYDLRLKEKLRFFSVNGNEDALVWRFADYGPKFITFHTALFAKRAAKKKNQKVSWSVEINSTLQRPFLKEDLQKALPQAGFRRIKFWGGLDGSPFIKNKSGDLVIVATI